MTKTVANTGSFSARHAHDAARRSEFADDLTVTQPGTATFATQVQSGKKYSVSVLTQPSNPVQTCSIANGSGTVTNAAAAPTINCVTQSPCLAGGFNTGDGQGRFLYLLNNGAASVAAFRLDPASASLQAASQRTPVRSRFSCIALENSPTWLTSVPRTYPQKLTLGPSMIGTGAGPSLLAFDAGGQNGYVVTSFDTPAYPVDSTTGMFNRGGGFGYPAGTAPVAFAVADSGRFAFGIRNATVETCQSHLGTVSTPNLNPPSVSATADALAVHPSGRFICVANADVAGTLQTFRSPRKARWASPWLEH